MIPSPEDFEIIDAHAHPFIDKAIHQAAQILVFDLHRTLLQSLHAMN